jgi:hypothetical protein
MNSQCLDVPGSSLHTDASLKGLCTFYVKKKMESQSTDERSLTARRRFEQERVSPFRKAHPFNVVKKLVLTLVESACGQAG